MAKKDIRLKAVKHMFDADLIKHFKDIFIYIPRSVVAKELHIANTRFAAMIVNTDLFKLSEIRAMAILFDIDYKKLATLAVESNVVTQKKPTKKKKV